jgi:hypothetical protein
MGDQTTADNIVTAKAGTVVAENLKLALATASGSLTPSTITAMVGIAQGTALQLAPDVQNAMTAMDAKIAELTLANTAPSLALAATITSAKANLITLQGKILPSGNHAAFGSFLNQAKSHIGDSTDLQNTTNFIGNSSFSDFGSGITNMSSMLDKGLTGKFGDLGAAGAALASGGSMFDGISPKNIGSPLGLVQSLNANKLGNATGVNALLTKAGVDITNLEDPVYADKISQVMGSIKDPKVLNAVADQFGQNPFGGLPSYTGSDSSLYTNSASKLLGGA